MVEIENQIKFREDEEEFLLKNNDAAPWRRTSNWQ